MPIYTITSDLGKENYLTAVIKACIYEHSASAQIVEISSEVEPYDIYQGAYLFKGAINYFPNDSHHFFMCGLYNNKQKQLLIAKYGNKYIYFTDNGFAPLALNIGLEVFAIKLDEKFTYNVGNIAKTFALASHFVNKGTKIEEFTTAHKLKFTASELDPIVNEHDVTAQVLLIDRFKNVVVNLTKEDFYKYKGDRNFKIEFIGKISINEIKQGYTDVDFGDKLCFFNNAGYLEIAVRGGQASELFGFETGEKVDSIYRTVKIFFE